MVGNIEVSLPDVSLPAETIGFLQRVLGPLAEAGDFLSDKIRFYRWKSSLSTIEEANRIAKANGIDPQQIPIKVLVPLLEKASLEEENSDLTSKWANLLASAARDKESVRPIFIDILSRLNGFDVKCIDEIVSDKVLDSVAQDRSDLSIQRIINIKIAVKLDSLLDTCRDRIFSAFKDMNDDLAYDKTDQIAGLLLGEHDLCFLETVRINSPTFKAREVWRHTFKHDNLSSIDVLVSCGLASRRTITFSNSLMFGEFTLVSPTVLGVEFTAACRGSSLQNSDEQ